MTSTNHGNLYDSKNIIGEFDKSDENNAQNMWTSESRVQFYVIPKTINIADIEDRKEGLHYRAE